jgi:uncharacterized protein YeaO (DUF488 family)
MDHVVRTKRVYEPKAEGDGTRILVDRLWPRGLTKAEVALDLWLKDVAPSTQLRRWFAHRPDRWNDFASRYVLELQSSAAVGRLRSLARAGSVTLLYAARDRDHNEATVLAAFLNDEVSRADH